MDVYLVTISETYRSSRLVRAASPERAVEMVKDAYSEDPSSVTDDAECTRLRIYWQKNVETSEDEEVDIEDY
jgi:hypothetical protein